jgi:hypothetical protein
MRHGHDYYVLAVWWVMLDGQLPEKFERYFWWYGILKRYRPKWIDVE